VITNPSVITIKWGQIKPSQPPRRVGKWGQISPSQRAGNLVLMEPPQTVTVGPTQAVTATVFNVSATPGSTVDATIDYYFKDGRVIEEQTSYRLVAENGLWKIDSSTVSSSQTK
jgi:hypothetical protein